MTQAASGTLSFKCSNSIVHAAFHSTEVKVNLFASHGLFLPPAGSTQVTSLKENLHFGLEQITTWFPDLVRRIDTTQDDVDLASKIIVKEVKRQLDL
jgi:hypothetical protein